MKLKNWVKRWTVSYTHLDVYKRQAERSGADIMVYMTQDALPADEKLIGNSSGNGN